MRAECFEKLYGRTADAHSRKICNTEQRRLTQGLSGYVRCGYAKMWLCKDAVMQRC